MVPLVRCVAPSAKAILGVEEKVGFRRPVRCVTVRAGFGRSVQIGIFLARRPGVARAAPLALRSPEQRLLVRQVGVVAPDALARSNRRVETSPALSQLPLDGMAQPAAGGRLVYCCAAVVATPVAHGALAIGHRRVELPAQQPAIARAVGHVTVAAALGSNR